MAKHLLEKAMATEEAFVDVDGLIYPEEFIKGLRNIGMEGLEEDEIMMLIDGLKFEGACERLCIHIQDLGEILKSYGVQCSPENLCDEDSLGSVIVRNDSSIDSSWADPGQLHIK